MLDKTRAIVLHSTKYSDTSVIVQLYTERFGRLSLMQTVSRGRKAQARASLLQPLFLLDVDIYYRSKREIQRGKEINLESTFRSIPYDAVKSSLALFMAEVLFKTLREEESNQSLFDFLYHSILILDTQEGAMGNFHLCFLVQLSRYLGFLPSNNYSAENKYFDVLAGSFCPFQPRHVHYFSPVVSEKFSQLLSLSLVDAGRVELSKPLRNELLEGILEYYQIHVDGMGTLKSLAVLKEVFQS